MIVVDSSFIAHQARHAVGHLGGDEKTGVMFGFLNTILTLGYRFSDYRFAFCFDHKRSYRKEALPGYKEARSDLRKEMEPEEARSYREMYRQLKLLRTQVLPEMGFANLFCQKGLEADDMMAVVVRRKKEGPFIVLSSDKDMLQILSPSVTILPKPKGELYTVSDFRDEWGIEPEKWGEVKAIGGCTGDNVPGVKGVKEKTAVKYLLRTLGPKTQAAANIRDGFQDGLVEFNRSLVVLPHARTKRVKIAEDSITRRKLLHVFRDLGFQHFRKESVMDRWGSFCQA